MKLKPAYKWLYPAVIFIAISVSGCCTSKDSAMQKNNQKSFNPEESIPHNSADIRAEVLEISENGGELKCLLKVEEVLRYGSSARQLHAGSEIEINLPDNILSAESTRKEIFLRISFYLPAGNQNGYWTFVKMNKQ